MAYLLRALASSPLSSHDHHRRHCYESWKIRDKHKFLPHPREPRAKVPGDASNPSSAPHGQASALQKSEGLDIQLRRCPPLRPLRASTARRVSEPPCEKSAAALRLSARLAMHVSPRNHAKTFVNDHSRSQRLSLSREIRGPRTNARSLEVLRDVPGHLKHVNPARAPAPTLLRTQTLAPDAKEQRASAIRELH